VGERATHVLEIEGWPPSVNRRYHPIERWRLARPFAEAVGWQARALGLAAPYERARVILTWLYPRLTDVQDVDNIYARATPLVNALKGIVIVDDDPEHVELVVRQQHVATPDKKRLVRIEIVAAQEV
jgi:hypothetical protein